MEKTIRELTGDLLAESPSLVKETKTITKLSGCC